MTTLYATVAVYDDPAGAENDWSALEAATERVDIADATLVKNRDGESVILQRQARHGWGKGAVAGAVVGVLFPPALLGAAAVGAGGGALVARFSRSLGRGKVKDLGDALDSGSLAIVVVEPAESAEAVAKTLASAKTIQTAPSAASEEIQALVGADGSKQ